ncbi:GNAT family N-acetyltransferase [Nonomuraea soli]|uniref:RimJ/RimL family protein N-acetyltransferase n=1 Tax=Nonomuraea soli TaxID=1032476 RepID=A0A7W0CM33_9ACTN|nr:GNAT family protein [Nonomuraea soli]MBA2893611.1 RimJ/RimL family protein N-acetyltransferase [Nonomuraea soli]
MTDLRAFEPTDAPLVASWIDSEESLVVWSGKAAFTWPFDPRQLVAFHAADPTRRPYTAVDRGGAPVGHLMLRSTGGAVRLGMVLVSPGARGHGHGEAMIVAGLAEAFASPEADSVELGVYAHNARAMRLYERLGFRPERVDERSVSVAGQWWDSVTMRLTRQEWLES